MEKQTKMKIAHIIRIFLCLTLALGWAEKMAMANDAADEQTEKEEQLKEARSIFEAITQKSPSETNILEFVKKSGVQGKDAIAVARSISVYALSSRDDPAKKAKIIEACADNNPDSAAIIYECALALEPAKESLVLYNNITSNPDFSITMRLQALLRLTHLGGLPDTTPDIIVSGLFSSNSGDQGVSRQLCDILKKTKTGEAPKYLEKIVAILKEKNALEKMTD